MRVYIPTNRSSYYVRFKFRGQAVFESLKTENKKTAQTRAQAIFDTAGERYYAGYKDGRTTTLLQIVNAYLIAPLGVSDVAKRANVSYLLKMAAPGVEREEVLKMPVSVLTDASVQRYQQSQLDKNRRPKSINSDVRQGRSVFSKRARAHFKGCSISLPINLREFLDTPQLVDRDEGGYEPIPRETIVLMDAAIEGLKQEDFEMWKIISLIRRTGMRNIEILNARAGWITSHGEQVVIDLRNRRAKNGVGDFRIKNRFEGMIVLDEELAEAFAGLLPDENLILPGATNTARQNLIDRKANKWLRTFIPDRVKCLYELRKEAGSIVAAERGMDASQQLMRHRDRKTTEDYYASALSPAVGVTITKPA